MAPSAGHVMVPKAVNAIRFAISRTTALLRARIAQAKTSSSSATSSPASLIPIPLRLAARNQTVHPLHPAALLRQSRSARTRFFSTARSYLSSSAAIAAKPTSFRNAARVHPSSATRTTLLTQTTHAPFASSLRPNLTGGTLSRSAGGYGALGAGGARGGVRAFSHVPAAQAQVVQNVSQAVRAFVLKGGRVQLDGVDQKGRERWGVVGVAREEVSRKMGMGRMSGMGMGMGMEKVKGTTVEFTTVGPVVGSGAAAAAAAAFQEEEAATLGSEDLLAEIAAEFEAARKTLVAVQADLQRLATLGSLPITSSKDGRKIEVRFPGCDGASVERLCVELGVQRGIVREDEEWIEGGEKESRDVEMALLFPWAPGPGSCADESEVEMFFEPPSRMTLNREKSFGWESMMTAASPNSHSRSVVSDADSSSLGVSAIDEVTLPGQTPTSRRSSIDEELFPASEDERVSYDEVGLSDLESNASFELSMRQQQQEASRASDVEGIYRFLAELDRAQR